MMTSEPKRKELHEAGHLVVAQFTNRLGLPDFQNKPKYVTREGQQRIFDEVCYWIAGGVAERVFCNFRGLPVDTTRQDLDTLYEIAKAHWGFRFEPGRDGVPKCLVLERLIKSTSDFVEALLRTKPMIFKVRNVATLLYKTGMEPDIKNEKLQRVINLKYNGKYGY